MNREVAVYALLVGSYFGYHTQFINGNINDKVGDYHQQVRCILGKVRKANQDRSQNEEINKIEK